MASLLEKLIAKSQGLKRRIASLLAVVVELLQSVPGLEAYAAIVAQAAGALGVVGTGHAAAAKTLSKARLATLSSVISALLLLAPFVPQLAVAVPALQKIAALLGAAALVKK